MELLKKLLAVLWTLFIAAAVIGTLDACSLSLKGVQASDPEIKLDTNIIEEVQKYAV